MDNCSIIIPHYNNPTIILNCLKELYKYIESNHEVIVIDNASTDNSFDLIKKKFPQVNLIRNTINSGYAGGCNLGAIKAKNDYLVFLNNDTEVTSNWINPLIKSLNNKKIASVQPKIKNLTNKNYFDYAGGSGGFIDVFCYPFCRGRIFNTVEEDKMQYNNEEEIFWASGTAFATKKDIFMKLGMFDEKLFAHMEEIDYHWKSQMSGYKILVNPESLIYHKGAQTLPYNSSQKTYLNHRNSLILFFGNHEVNKILLLFIPRIFLQFVSIMFDLVSLRILNSIAQIKSILWITLNISYIIKKRRFNKLNKNKSYKLIGMFKKSIVINYFLLNKKKYTDY